ncbi:DUF4105 domain-containing protein [Pandoraea nosoerga]|uniref:Lnb N-terminal periplasmic domain-containing protein n=2 Tax=Pandoraea nosoerga TaxID=2508296 RepID=A0A5E4SRK8_9BURK|nr:DUF4105 domain-containing protein [Pandoraea nosoerga]MBN4674581.1 DUF4105 domain-containing protein [Pandoraea nosoerga]MBN4680469.1 DUF4105 domain-containing protein [Pandoraea nosoerga]MBN4743874.1 DUF4105 domain-containing protein [Pandoraea nosoerga]VVD77523.1 hypothetical protein PNO31109_00913 [Pandoraea nosoerga]
MVQLQSHAGEALAGPHIAWYVYVLRSCLALVVLGACAWGAMALTYRCPGPGFVRYGVVALWVLLGIAALLALWRVRAGASLKGWPLAFTFAMILLLGWWQTIRPSNDREWAADVAEMLDSRQDGTHVTLHNVRNFAWRSETDFTPRWETREYDLDKLVSADLVLSYWMGPAIAHTLVSFGFSDGRRVVFSIEIRKKRGQKFSAIGGFFKDFEATLVAADERDILRVRSNVRGETVYLYRLNIPPAQLRRVFVAYLERAAELRREPAWYNTLTSNCTTIVFEIARLIAPGLPLDYRLLLSGYFAEYAFDQGGLTPGFTYAELQARGNFVARALAAGDAPDFSAQIRQGVPGDDPRVTP